MQHHILRNPALIGAPHCPNNLLGDLTRVRLRAGIDLEIVPLK
ncbi:MAG: hypothetical protein ACK2US_06730 [Anaerolineae bacterium]